MDKEKMFYQWVPPALDEVNRQRCLEMRSFLTHKNTTTPFLDSIVVCKEEWIITPNDQSIVMKKNCGKEVKTSLMYYENCGNFCGWLLGVWLRQSWFSALETCQITVPLLPLFGSCFHWHHLTRPVNVNRII